MYPPYPQQNPINPVQNPAPTPAPAPVPGVTPQQIAQNPLIQQTMQQNPQLQQYVNTAQQNYNAVNQPIQQPGPQNPAPTPAPAPYQPVPNQNYLPAQGNGQVNPAGIAPEGGTPPQHQPQQPLPPQQYQQQPPQQQQQQPENWEVAVDGYENVDPDVLQDAIDRYHEQGYTPEQAQEAMAQEAQMGGFNFADLETKQVYDNAKYHLEDALVQKYGQDGAVEAFQTIYHNIHAQGGDALLQKFLSDPEMMEPEIVMGYLHAGDDEQGGGGNPYLDHMRDTTAQANPGFGPGQGAAPMGGGGPGMSMDQIAAEEKNLYSQLASGDPSIGQKLLQLGVTKRRMAAQHNQNAMMAGMSM